MNRTSYPYDCIVASGFAIMSAAIAYELRPDLWACLEDCKRTLDTRVKTLGTQRLVVTFERLGSVMVLARSLDQLPQRLEWIAGSKVIDIRQAADEPLQDERPDPLRQEQAAKEADRLARVRRLAKEDPPSHDCHQRREILAARKELGMAVI